MTYAEALRILLTIPATFRRTGANYAAWQASQMAAIGRFVEADSNIVAQIGGLNAATAKWLDVFGILFSVVRNSGERDMAYSGRIYETCQARRVTPEAIEVFLAFTLGATATVTESFPSVGYALSVSKSLIADDEKALDTALDWVRPVGVPYSYGISFGALYLTSGTFRGLSRSYGSYLTPGTKKVSPLSGGTTNGLPSTLPTTFLTDPLLNASS